MPYIWIDSLCIVQDDQEDWAKEASSMASVYKYAYLVIAATSSKNGDDGCLRPRVPSQDISDPFNGSFYVQQYISHGTIIGWQAGSNDMPLLDRAWCFQERMLASRILHYTEREMMWECHKELWCECQTIKCLISNLEKPATVKLSYAAAVASTDPNVRAKAWDKFVREYSQRSLTFGTDRLPGISGIARHIALPSMGRYLAGIWECQLPEALLWTPTGGVPDRRNVLPRPLQYTAPTWSWASILSAAVPDQSRKCAKSINLVCRVIDVECTPKTSDLYGHVIDGQLRISGPAIAATLVRSDCESVATSYFYEIVLETQDVKASKVPSNLTMTNDVELMETTIRVVILFMEIRSYHTLPEDEFDSLALIQPKTHKGCWERIGRVHGWGLDLSQFKEREFIIV